jgi:NADH dehydrogenase/NADH:ubiquinone oxidoreductase subunit G
MLAIAGDLVDAESLICLKDLFNRAGSDNLQTNVITPLSSDARSQYLFNSTIAGIEEADVVILVGSNPRMESPLICSRIRKSVLHAGQKVYSIGPDADLALKHKHLGNRASLIQDIIDDRIPAAATIKKVYFTIKWFINYTIPRIVSSKCVTKMMTFLKIIYANRTQQWREIELLLIHLRILPLIISLSDKRLGPQILFLYGCIGEEAIGNRRYGTIGRW